MTAATYRHPVLGPRPLNAVEAVRLLRKVTSAYSEVIEGLYEYDAENPDVWAGCSEHPEGCGYRDLPSFFITACATQCDVQDAETFLAAYDSQSDAAIKPQYLTYKDAATYLSTTVPALKKRVQLGEIRYCLDGRRVRFDRHDLDTHMRRNRIEAWAS